eukprot:GHRQ01035692.1.p1 GENE.GHRQ01035692.1~~GHRQ01035692.1.p1  ORF type:complete len:157 (+),score=8.21 GHRQ01035692.1:99-569(+)
MRHAEICFLVAGVNPTSRSGVPLYHNLYKCPQLHATELNEPLSPCRMALSAAMSSDLRSTKPSRLTAASSSGPSSSRAVWRAMSSAARAAPPRWFLPLYASSTFATRSRATAAVARRQAIRGQAGHATLDGSCAVSLRCVLPYCRKSATWMWRLWG